MTQRFIFWFLLSKLLLFSHMILLWSYSNDELVTVDK